MESCNLDTTTLEGQHCLHIQLVAPYQICLGKSQLSNTFQLINTYISTEFKLRTKKALDFFFFSSKKGASAGARKGKNKKLTLFLSNRHFRKSEIEAVGWSKRKPHSLEAMLPSAWFIIQPR